MGGRVISRKTTNRARTAVGMELDRSLIARLERAIVVCLTAAMAAVALLSACTATSLLETVRVHVAATTEGVPSGDTSSGDSNAQTVSTPTFTPTAGTYSSDQQVSITDSTSGATIYYTTDGSTPTTASTAYTGAVPVAGDGTTRTIHAVAVASGMNDSEVATATYTIDYSQVSTPQFNPSGPTTFTAAQNVTITDSTVGSTIYYSYTTDNSAPPDPDPANASTYNGSGAATGVTVAVSGTGTKWNIKAIATKGGMSNSTVGTSDTYTVSYPAPAPTFDKGSSTYTVTNPASLTVTITNTAGNGSSVSYTTDGSQPSTTHGTVSNAGSFPVTISTTGTTLKAIGFGGPYSISTSTTSATYILQAAAPQFSPNGGSFSNSPSISISATTMGTTIRYTTDGSTPTTGHGTVYSGTFTLVPGRFTLKAIAYNSGLMTSTVSTSATYYVYPVYSIGATGPAGGIIFYANPSYVADGWRYLEAAPSSQSTGIVWWNGSNVTTGATGLVIGTGKANTTAIVDKQGAGSYAAQLCNDLVLGGYGDWFLPSKDELNQMYLQLAAIWNYPSVRFWSSSEFDAGSAWNQYFLGGSQDVDYKFTNVRVRAVRAF